jgi:large subunit ribosomal protein L10
MENPRAEKVAVVDEVRERLEGARAAILTEYRGLSVREMATLRQALVAAGGDYKVYKNTLVKLAIAGGRHEPLDALLQGPTAIAFVSGEVSAVAKGGLHGDGFLSPEDLGVLADLPPRDVLLARMAGAIAAPMQQLAGLMQALPRSLAYGLSALLDQKGGAPAEAEAPSEAEAPAEAEAPPADPAAEAEVEAPAEAKASPAEPAAEAEVMAEAPPVKEASAEEPPATASAEPEAAPATDEPEAGANGDGE